MKRTNINLAEFRRDNDAALVTALMMASNDMERLRSFIKWLEQQPKASIEAGPGSYRRSIFGYVYGLFIGHTCEAYEILKRIHKGKTRDIRKVISANKKLDDTFKEACKYIKADSTGTYPLHKWEQFRHKAVFHFNPKETEIKRALKLAQEKYGYSPLYFGDEKERTFYELAFEVVDAIGSEALGFKYGDESAARGLVKEFAPIATAMRKFYRLLIETYAKQYELKTIVPEISAS